jgi:hypothetical protein
MGTLTPGSGESTARSPSPPVPTVHPSEGTPPPAGLAGGHEVQGEGRAPGLTSPSSWNKADPSPQSVKFATATSQPTQERRFGLRFFGRKKDIGTQPTPQPEPADQPIWKQPPHRINSQLITTLPLLPELPPSPPPPPPSPPPPPRPPAQPPLSVGGVIELAQPSTAVLDEPHTPSRDVAKLVLPTLAEIAKKRKTNEDRVERRPPQQERHRADDQPMPESLLDQGEDDDQDSRWFESGRSRDEEIYTVEDPPATASSAYSVASTPTTLSDYPNTPSSVASADSFLSDTPSLSVPPSPWLDKAFHDLPFGPNVPAVSAGRLEGRGSLMIANTTPTDPARRVAAGPVADPGGAAGRGRCGGVCAASDGALGRGGGFCPSMCAMAINRCLSLCINGHLPLHGAMYRLTWSICGVLGGGARQRVRDLSSWCDSRQGNLFQEQI